MQSTSITPSMPKSAAAPATAAAAAGAGGLVPARRQSKRISGEIAGHSATKARTDNGLGDPPRTACKLITGRSAQDGELLEGRPAKDTHDPVPVKKTARRSEENCPAEGEAGSQDEVLTHLGHCLLCLDAKQVVTLRCPRCPRAAQELCLACLAQQICSIERDSVRDSVPGLPSFECFICRRPTFGPTSTMARRYNITDVVRTVELQTPQEAAAAAAREAASRAQARQGACERQTVSVRLALHTAGLARPNCAAIDGGRQEHKRLDRLTVGALQAECGKAGLPLTGHKSQMCERLLDSWAVAMVKSIAAAQTSAPVLLARNVASGRRRDHTARHRSFDADNLAKEKWSKFHDRFGTRVWYPVTGNAFTGESRLLKTEVRRCRDIHDVRQFELCDDSGELFVVHEDQLSQLDVVEGPEDAAAAVDGDDQIAFMEAEEEDEEQQQQQQQQQQQDPVGTEELMQQELGAVVLPPTSETACKLITGCTLQQQGAGGELINYVEKWFVSDGELAPSTATTYVRALRVLLVEHKKFGLAAGQDLCHLSDDDRQSVRQSAANKDGHGGASAALLKLSKYVVSVEKRSQPGQEVPAVSGAKPVSKRSRKDADMLAVQCARDSICSRPAGHNGCCKLSQGRPAKRQSKSAAQRAAALVRNDEQEDGAASVQVCSGVLTSVCKLITGHSAQQQGGARVLLSRVQRWLVTEEGLQPATAGMYVRALQVLLVEHKKFGLAAGQNLCHLSDDDRQSVRQSAANKGGYPSAALSKLSTYVSSLETQWGQVQVAVKPVPISSKRPKKRADLTICDRTEDEERLGGEAVVIQVCLPESFRVNMSEDGAARRQSKVDWLTSYSDPPQGREEASRLRAEAQELLEQFGHRSFQPLQLDVIVAAAQLGSRKSIVAHVATGGGKTLIYSIVARMQYPCITLVFEPLSVLAGEQHERAIGLGMKSIRLKSGDDIEQVMDAIIHRRQECELLFLTPEMCDQNKYVRPALGILCRANRLRVTIDEAHYVAQCEVDSESARLKPFRPSYRALGQMLRELDLRVLFLTASMSAVSTDLITANISMTAQFALAEPEPMPFFEC